MLLVTDKTREASTDNVVVHDGWPLGSITNTLVTARITTKSQGLHPGPPSEHIQ